MGKVDIVDVYPLTFEEFVLERLGQPMLETLMDADPSLAEAFKGRFVGAQVEQYVCQQLIASCGMCSFYWSAENSRGEVDFLAQSGGNVYAIEVKAEENLKAKSLRSFKQKYPEVRAVRFSLSGYREEEWMENVPLYLVGNKQLWV